MGIAHVTEIDRSSFHLGLLSPHVVVGELSHKHCTVDALGYCRPHQHIGTTIGVTICNITWEGLLCPPHMQQLMLTFVLTLLRLELP